MLRIKPLILSLICVLLLVQSAAAMHDVAHQDLGHAQSCEILLSLDHQSCIETSESKLATAQTSQQVILQGTQFIITRTSFSFTPRAPPIA